MEVVVWLFVMLGFFVFSVGSVFTVLCIEVVFLLREVGFLVDGLCSKGLDEIFLSELDVIIMLCVEECCFIMLFGVA